MRTTLLAMSISICSFANVYSQTTRIHFFGVGTGSCASWLSTENNKFQGDVWILGAWSGMNVYNTKNHVVGSNTDAQGLIAEVRAVCVKSPSLVLHNAVIEAYVSLWGAGR